MIVNKIIRSKTDENNIIHYELQSGYEPENNVIRVYIPSAQKNNVNPDVVFVLPVEEKLRTRYGDGMDAIMECKRSLLDKFIFVAPSFNSVPWYIDVKDSRGLLQESYFIKSIIPFTEYILETAFLNSYMLGFSKSGWGAMRMMCRFPQLFAGISIWDAPLNLTHPLLYRASLTIAGEKDKDLYALVLKVKERFLTKTKIALTGYDYFKEPMNKFHYFLERENIPHYFDNSTFRKHVWGSGWVEQLLGFIDEMKKTNKNI